MAWQELHLNNNNTTLGPSATEVNSNYNWVFSETKDTIIRAVGISIGGPAFAADEYGYLYLWRDADHFTFMLPCALGADRKLYIVLPDEGLVIPAGENYCFRWWFNKLTAPRAIFADIAFEQRDPIV